MTNFANEIKYYCFRVLDAWVPLGFLLKKSGVWCKSVKFTLHTESKKFKKNGNQAQWNLSEVLNLGSQTPWRNTRWECGPVSAD